MSELAIFGGTPALPGPLRPYRTVGAEEAAAVARVMESGVLSGFVGAWCPEFNGGPVVQDFEAAWSATFGCRHSISVNSNTSGLIASVGAARVGPGDEVIVPPYTMSATAVAPLFYGGIPVFVDIEPETFCLDPAKVRAAITPRTRAIIVVNLFGHPAALHELRAIADEHGLILIEDNAQGPLASEHGRYAGTIGHIGVFSLNYHKHFHTGEGGVCTTDDDGLARRLMMIRNHGENVVDDLPVGDIVNLIGFNFRLTELSAAVGLEQLRKIVPLVDRRIHVAERLSAAVRDMPGITAPVVKDGCRHVYYVWSARFDESIIGVSRQAFADALTAEGCPNSLGYVQPLYMLPVFRKGVAIGRDGFPFNLTNRSYGPGLCPVAERMHQEELLEFHVCSYEMSDADIDGVVAAFRKVYDNRHRLPSGAPASA